MADYITTRQYADLHGIPIETVRTWTKCKKISFIKVGDSILIERSTPIPAKRKRGVKSRKEIAERSAVEHQQPKVDSQIQEQYEKRLANYITTRQYADMHGIPIETVRTWTKYNKIPFIKVGDSIMIERSTPIPAKSKPGFKSKKEIAEPSKYKIKIKRAYYVSVEDSAGKKVASGFTFLDKADAERVGKRLISEIESLDN